jgi:xylan 1,4-beta-xylosidase
MNYVNQELVDIAKDIPIHIQIFHGEDTKREWHDAMELLFVLSGETDIIVEDKSIHLVEEDVFLIKSKEIHEVVGNKGSILSIRFSLKKLKYFDSTEEMYFALNSARDTNNRRYDYVRHLIAKLVKVNASGENQYLTLSVLYDMIGHLLDNFSSVAPVNITSSYKYRDRMVKILDYIEEHYKDGLTLKEVADQHNLSVSYFSTFFEKNMEMTFLTYYNELRLKYTVNEMLSSDDSLENIALNNGFRDYRSFNSLFKKRYDSLPSDYRKKHRNFLTDTRNPMISEGKLNNSNDDMDELRNLAKYLSISEDNSNLHAYTKAIDMHIDGGTIDYAKKGTTLTHNYRKLCCVGSAKHFLYAEIQEMIRAVQKDIHYDYVKFHGLLSDEMMVYKEKDDGTPVYSFTLIDKVIDFLLSVDLKPLVQLSFMPRDLASDPDKLIDMWHYNTSPPKDLKKWTDLVEAVVRHLISRYGIDEVRSWLFCVWNEPDGSIDSFGWENPEEFYHFYKETYFTVKRIDANLAFGTPSLLLLPNSEHNWTLDFFNYSIENNCFADFLNIHYYDNSFVDEQNEFDSFSISNIGKPCPLNVDPFAFTKFINQVEMYRKELKISTQPIYLTEWNLTISQRDLINDTCFKSCYLTKNLLENYDRLDSFGYWCITDFMEELQLPNALYHGGLGMFTYNGIPKAHYNTFKFLSNLGNELIANGNGYFITKEEKKIVILLYNYEHYSKLFASGILFDMSDENRYAPFTKMNQAKFQINFKNLPSNSCLIKQMIANQQQGSSYDAWAKMGSRTFSSKKELELLKELSQPGVTMHQEIIINGELNFTAYMEPLEVRMIEIMLD